jgi:hypothetical protein
VARIAGLHGLKAANCPAAQHVLQNESKLGTVNIGFALIISTFVMIVE